MVDSTSVSFHDVVRVFWRRKALLIGSFVLFMILACICILLRKDDYKSTAKLFIRVGRENLTLDPTVTTGQTISLRSSRETEINSVIEMLKSRPVVEQTVSGIGANRILDSEEKYKWVAGLKRGVRETKSRIKSLFVAELNDGSDSEHRAVSKIMENVSITAPEMSTVIRISYTTGSPRLAQDVVAKMIDVYQQEHIRLNRTEGSEEFFREQTERLQEQLTESKCRMSRIKNEYGFASIGAQFSLLEQRKAAIEQLLLENYANLSAADAKLKELTTVIGGMESTVLVQRVDGIGNNGVEGMRQQLFDLEIKEQELLSKYDKSHPFVRAQRRQVADARKIIESLTSTQSQSTFAMDPSRQQLRLEQLREKANQAAMIATKEVLDEQHESVLTELRQLNEYSPVYDELEQEIAMLSTNVRTHRESLEQARISSALRDHRITNVSVVQPASFVPKPIGPGTMLLGIIGLILALIGGLGVASAAEVVDPTFRSRMEIENLLGIPVLVSIPRCSHPMSGV